MAATILVRRYINVCLEVPFLCFFHKLIRQINSYIMSYVLLLPLSKISASSTTQIENWDVLSWAPTKLLNQNSFDKIIKELNKNSFRGFSHFFICGQKLIFVENFLVDNKDFFFILKFLIFLIVNLHLFFILSFVYIK